MRQTIIKISSLLVSLWLSLTWAQEAVTVIIAKRQITFKFVALEDASPMWYEIYASDSEREVLASQHALVKQEKPSCDTLYFLRAWLTAADNGVNGKKSKGFKPVNGAADEALKVKSKADSFYNKLKCGQQNQAADFNCSKSAFSKTHQVSACTDLKSLAELATGINQEAKLQSMTGRQGAEFY